MIVAKTKLWSLFRILSTNMVYISYDVLTIDHIIFQILDLQKSNLKIRPNIWLTCTNDSFNHFLDLVDSIHLVLFFFNWKMFCCHHWVQAFLRKFSEGFYTQYSILCSDNIHAHMQPVLTHLFTMCKEQVWLMICCIDSKLEVFL